MAQTKQGKILPKYVHKYSVKGHSYLYFVREGLRIRLYNDPGTKEFRREYLIAHRTVPPAPPQSMTAKKKTIIRRLARAPKEAGVYLLFFDGALVYVGASLDMSERVKSHATNGRPFDRAYFIKTTPSERFAVEKALINALSPRQNRERRQNGKNETRPVSEIDSRSC